MLPRADIIAVQPVGQAQAVTGAEGVSDARQEVFQRSLAGLLGKSLQAQILTKLTDGSFIVKVAGASARMLLPAGAQVGSEVPMTLVSLSPRPTFQLSTGQQQPVLADAALAQPSGLPQAAAAAAQAAPRTTSYAAALLGKAPLIPADQLPALDPASTPASLSAAAKAITSVLTTALKAPNAPNAIVATTPLVKAPGVAPETLAAALKDAVGNSGLFYESHVVEWLDGKRPLAELVREPQMQKALNANGPEAGLRQQAPATDPATAQFINLQLSTHEQARVAWQGQVWPGQHMQWEINKDAPDGRGSAGESAGGEPVWRSGVRFRFPLLGEIAATVQLVGDRLHVQIQAGSSDIGGLLRTHAGALSAALDAAGTPLSSLQIGAEPAAPP